MNGCSRHVNWICSPTCSILYPVKIELYAKEMANSSHQGNGIYNPAKLKLTLKIAISKLKYIQDKKQAVSRQQKRLIADLLKRGRENNALIRVELTIREDIYIELLEILELYCELLAARIMLLSDPSTTTCDPSLKEAVSSVIYAADHSELKELITIKDILVHKFGVDFGRKALTNEEGIVPKKVISKCNLVVVPESLTTSYLCEIAKVYDVPYSGLRDENSDDLEKSESVSVSTKDNENLRSVEANEGNKDRPNQKQSNDLKVKPADDFEALKARFDKLKG